jgi:Family of unknown function (DUF5996)
MGSVVCSGRGPAHGLSPAAFDPAAKELDLLGRPLSVAGYGPGADRVEDGVGVGANVVVCAAFCAYAYPAPQGFADSDLSPGRWDLDLGEFLLDWDDVVATSDPHSTGLDFVRSAARQACALCAWDHTLATSLDGDPPPIR